jgi:L-asparaginase
VAFALDLLWESEVPVVVTGAMRNASLIGADGGANLLASAVTAATPSARGLGVVVVLNDEIHAARLARKVHTTSPATFASPGFGPLGYVHEGEARIVLRPADRSSVPVPSAPVADWPVALLKVGLGDDGRLLEPILAAGFRGVVIEAFGGGHLPPAIAESAALREIVDQLPVVLASRTGSGEVLTKTYSGWVGSEADLLARGLVSAGGLDGPKARILLSLLLSGAADLDGVAQAFARHGRYGGGHVPR